MNKYSFELINDYINGCDIDSHDILDLENDKAFMKAVINYSKDYKMYYFCSDNLKEDYSFVKYIIYKFKNNTDFIIDVADYFIKNTNKGIEKKELTIIMSELIKDNSNEKEFYYKARSNAIYFKKNREIALIKYKLEDEEYNKKIGMGFIYFYDEYNSSDIILKFIAHRIMYDIFLDYEINLEEMLHKDFKKAKDLEDNSINIYLMNLIGKYDPMLGSYLSTHINLLSPIKERVLEIKNNWDNYNNMIEQEKYNLMFKRVSSYMKDSNSKFGETFYIYYIGDKLNVIDKISKYDVIDSVLFKEISKDMNNDFIDETLKNDFVERLCYNNVRDIMIETLLDKKIVKDNKNKGKVLKLDFNNNTYNN